MSSAGSLQAAAEGQAAALTPEQQAQAVQLAQTLDELDRQLAAAQAQRHRPDSSRLSNRPDLSRLSEPLSQAQAAQAQQGAAGSSPASGSTAGSSGSLAQSSQQSADGFSEPPDAQPFEVSQVSRRRTPTGVDFAARQPKTWLAVAVSRFAEAWRRCGDMFPRCCQNDPESHSDAKLCNEEFGTIDDCLSHSFHATLPVESADGELVLLHSHRAGACGTSARCSSCSGHC
ncbi:MAG UNVERIFIED_CONTAM: hypothetical protein LVR18_25245 [Planctomycetaceae bacterium]